MRDDTYWSVSVGRWADVSVRLHASLFIAAAAMLHLGGRPEGGWSAVAALVGLMVYLASLALREFVRSCVAWKCGDQVERIVLGPAGAIVRPTASLDPQWDPLIAVSAPAANLALALLAAAATALLGGAVSPLFVPLAPPSAALEFSFLGFIAWVGWINWVLAIVSLVPAFPLSGSQIALALCRRRVEEVAARAAAARIGVAASLVLFVVAVFVRARYEMGSLVVSLSSILLFFCSLRELRRVLVDEDEDDADDGDLPSGDREERQLRADRIGPLRRWWQRRQEQRRLILQETEREEEARADEVLARLHSQGMQALSPAERALLERVSARYRRRQHQD